MCSKLSSGIKEFLGTKIDLLLFVDGIYLETEFSNTEDIKNDPRTSMKLNFLAPMYAISALLPYLKNGKGRVASFMAPSCT